MRYTHGSPTTRSSPKELPCTDKWFVIKCPFITSHKLHTQPRGNPPVLMVQPGSADRSLQYVPAKQTPLLLQCALVLTVQGKGAANSGMYDISANICGSALH
jgi:hypothetical protein